MLTEDPRLPPSADHSESRTSWVSLPRQAIRASSPKELSIRSFPLYILRFVYAAELRGALDTLGGIALQIAHLSKILNLSITESAGDALLYRLILAGNLQERD